MKKIKFFILIIFLLIILSGLEFNIHFDKSKAKKTIWGTIAKVVRYCGDLKRSLF